LLDSVESLLESEHPSRAVTLGENAIGRATDPALKLQLRETLAVALYLAGEYTRAAALFDAVRGDYARFRPDEDPAIRNCAYQAGQAYAEIGQHEEALRCLRFYVAHSCLDEAAQHDPEEVLKILESRYQIASMLSATGKPARALAELRDIRPYCAAVYGEASTMVANIDKQINRLTMS
jgi:tetratricopeptide (TPR) repeat protein